MKIYLKGGPRDGETAEINGESSMVRYPYWGQDPEFPLRGVQFADHIRTNEYVDGMRVYEYVQPPEIIESFAVNQDGALKTMYRAKRK